MTDVAVIGARIAATACEIVGAGARHGACLGPATGRILAAFARPQRAARRPTPEPPALRG